MKYLDMKDIKTCYVCGKRAPSSKKNTRKHIKERKII